MCDVPRVVAGPAKERPIARYQLALFLGQRFFFFWTTVLFGFGWPDQAYLLMSILAECWPAGSLSGLAGGPTAQGSV